jgi:hypothetical protein
MVKNKQVPAEYNTVKKEVQDLNMSYLRMRKEKQTPDWSSKTGDKEQDSAKTNKKNPNTKSVLDVFKSQFSRVESSTSKNAGATRTTETRSSALLDSSEIEALVLNKHESKLQRENSPALNSPLEARKFGNHVLYERIRSSSLPRSLPCSAVNSPQLRRNSDFLLDTRKNGLGVKDLRTLSNSLTLLEKPKPRPKPYEEQPFYLCPQNGSFRGNYWKSESIALEKRLEAQRREVSRVEEEVKAEKPLAEILPPMVLSSIYTQESNKAKRTIAEKGTRKNMMSGKKPGSNERLTVDASRLTKDLNECRYLRLPKKL